MIIQSEKDSTFYYIYIYIYIYICIGYRPYIYIYIYIYTYILEVVTQQVRHTTLEVLTIEYN